MKTLPVLICGASGQLQPPAWPARWSWQACVQGRRGPQQALPDRERPLSWPQPAAHCLATWLRLLKCHSLSGPHWACLLGPLRASVGVFTRTLPGLLAPHRLLSQALAAQNSFMGFPITGSHHSNSQPCWARPACAAGPGREGVGARLATGAWV